MSAQLVTFLVATLYARGGYSSLYHGPTALPVVQQNGYLADTHEVAAAKSAHLATLSHQSHGGSHDTQHRHQGDLRYHGPIAIPHVFHDGHIADTHEVASAKAEHFTAVAEARTHGGYSHEGDYSGQYNHQSVASGAHNTHYHGPIAVPHVLHDGHIADTHEVAAAKAEHLAAVAKAQAHGGYSHEGDYSGQYNQKSGVSEDHNTPYRGPIAIPHVLHDGHIADTHEVAAAKAEHLAAVAKAQAHGGYSHEGDYSGQYNHNSGVSEDHNTPYHGPIAVPHVLSNGFLADTHEVAALKEKHLQALHSAPTGGHYSG